MSSCVNQTRGTYRADFNDIVALAGPAPRGATQVAIDLRERWVSPEAARETYRVALDDAGGRGDAATERLRNG